MQWAKQKQAAFTIVELLIVVVVIAILAAITIVAYNGIQNRAKDSAAQSAASQASKKVLADAVLNAEQYPASLSAIGVQNSSDTAYQYSVNNAATPRYYCITATTAGRSFFVSSTNPNPSAGGCPGHGVNGVAAITNLAHSPRATSIYPSGIAGKAGWYGRWYGLGSTGTTTPVTGAGDGPAGTGITSYLRKQWNAIGSHTYDVGWGHTETGINALPVTPGQTLTISSYVRSSLGHTDTGQRRLWYTFYDAAGNNFGSNASTNVNLPADQWVRLSATTTVPANAAFMSVRQDLFLSMTVNATLDATGLMITQGSTLYSFADGASSNWVWNGTPNDATSTGAPL